MAELIAELPGKLHSWAMFNGELVLTFEDAAPHVLRDGKLVELTINPEVTMADKARDAYEVLNDPAARVGATVAIGYRPIGSSLESGLILAEVGVDALGRLWRVDQHGNATLFFDPREYESARDAGPVELPDREGNAES